MEFTDRPGKRVTFEEPLCIDIVERADEKELEYYKRRPRSHFRVILWAFAAAFLVFMLGGSHGKFSSIPAESIKRSYNILLGVDTFRK
jgi:hypothetical protein